MAVVENGYAYFDYSANQRYTAGQTMPTPGVNDEYFGVTSTGATDYSKLYYVYVAERTVTYSYYSSEMAEPNFTIPEGWAITSSNYTMTNASVVSTIAGKNVVSVNKIKISVRKSDKKSPIKLNEKNIITKSWKKGIISNYEYLLFLNRYGSRSFQDPTQYPVFPWVLNDYKNLETFQKKEKIFLKILNAIEKIQESIEDEKINSFSHVQIDKFILDELNDKLKNKYQDKIKFNKGECKEIIS